MNALRGRSILWAAILFSQTGCTAIPVGEVPEDRTRLPDRVKTILVAPFMGNEEWARRASETIITDLARRERKRRKITFLGPRDLIPRHSAGREPQFPTPPRTVEEAARMGRAADADAVLFGRLTITILRPEKSE